MRTTLKIDPVSLGALATGHRGVIASLELPTDERAWIDAMGLSPGREVTVLRRAFRRQTAFKQVVGAWRGVHRIATFILLLTLVTHVVTVLYFSVG